MKTQVNRIISVCPLEAMTLSVQYQNGQTVTLDCSELPQRFAVFAPLCDPDFFRQVTVADWGHSLEWPHGEGLDADRVLEMALEQKGRVDTLAFRQWQDTHRLSLAQAAQALGMSRRTASQYRTGARRVPRIVLLALKGWETETATQVSGGISQ